MSTLQRAGSALALTALTLGLAATGASAASLLETGGAARNSGDQTQALRDSIADSGARNVILLIGDGMGDSEITVARNYVYGAAGRFPGIDSLPITGQYTTYSLNKGAPGASKPDYAPDSASTGTAWATGTKTYDGAISVDLEENDLDSLLEIAKANGLRTGDVSTAAIQDATPAVQVASVTSRSCYGPELTSQYCPTNAIEYGGAGSISEQLLDTRPDVTLGGGSASFDEYAAGGPWAGKTLWEQAEDRGYQVVRTAEELGQVESIDAPVLGLFTESHFPTRFAPTYATENGANGEALTCSENPDRLSTDLSLGALTSTAIDLLDDPSSDKGFFLQVEGASIDKQDHAANACGQIGETIDLDEAVQAALEFAQEDGETLVIVTADHAHTSQIVGEAGPGLSIKLTTADMSPMIVAYGTAPEGSSQQHTGAQLRIAAYGPGAANVAGLTDQTDTFFTIANGLGLERDLNSLSWDAQITVPSAVTPGSSVDIALTGMDGDKTVTATMAGTDLGQGDLLGGAATVTATAPTAPGDYEIRFTGGQTGVQIVGTLTVTADAAGAIPVVFGNDVQPPAAEASMVAPEWALPISGAELAGVALLALAAGLAGVAVVRTRRTATA